MSAKVGSFIKGLMGDNASLDEVLSGKVVDKQYRLIDLKRSNVLYDADNHTISIDKTRQVARGRDVPPQIEVAISPEFHDYMEKHGDSVRYMTRNGTPWLTEQEKGDTQKVADYYEALKAGTRKDVAIINWRKTHGATRDTGHSAVSVGELSFADENGEIADPRNIGSYEQHAGGSFYPSPSMWRDRKAMGESKLRDTGESEPSSHAQGVLVRNTIKPTAAAAAAGAAALAATTSKKKKGGALRTALRAATVGFATYAGGYVVGSTQTSPGSIKIQDEPSGHGVLATLVSEAQHDIMEHTLVGLSKTYHGQYNVFRSNCADFAEDMLDLIGLNTHELVQTAMETEPQCGTQERRKISEIAIPHTIRPDRNSWAMKQLETGENGVLNIDDQDLCLRKFNVSGQSALLIEAADGEKLKHAPLETLSKVLSEGIGLAAPKGPNRAEFTFNENVKTQDICQTR